MRSGGAFVASVAATREQPRRIIRSAAEGCAASLDDLGDGNRARG